MIKILIIAPAMPSPDLVEVVPQTKIWSGKYAGGDLIWLSQPHPDLLVASTRPSATKFGPVPTRFGWNWPTPSRLIQSGSVASRVWRSNLPQLGLAVDQRQWRPQADPFESKRANDCSLTIEVTANDHVYYSK